MDNEKYAYWMINSEESSLSGKRYFYNCSHCGCEAQDDKFEVCPECKAKMVQPLDKKDVNGHDLCLGDTITCSILGRSKPVTGKIAYDGMWYFDNPVYKCFMYDCKKIQVVEGIIPEGKHISRDFENEIKRQRKK